MENVVGNSMTLSSRKKKGKTVTEPIFAKLPLARCFCCKGLLHQTS